MDREILVVGGGVTGLAASVALAQAGLTVTCVDPGPAPDKAKTDQLDGRTTALFEPSLRALRSWGAWPLDDQSAALWRMRIVDETCGGVAHGATFDSRELRSGGPFGHNVPTPALKAALAARARALTVDHRTRTEVARLTLGQEAAEADLTDGTCLRAPLVVGADGRGSSTRQSAGIPSRTWSYGQTAMAFAVGHGAEHEGTSTEFHRRAGPLVTVPLPGRASSIVWVERDATVAQLGALDRRALRHPLARRLHGVLGQVHEIGPVWRYPVSSVLAATCARRRVALVGEAAHGMPPVGAQGLNLGLTDVAVLAELVGGAKKGGADIGGPAVIDAYAARRQPDILTRVAGVDALNHAVRAHTPIGQRIRRAGVHVLARFSPVRRAVMQAGMSPLGEAPAVMRDPAPASAQ